MNNRALTMSLVIGFIAVYLVWSWVSGIEEQAQVQYGTKVLVLKAKRDIKEQETILEDMLELQSVPKTFVEPTAVYFVPKASDPEDDKRIQKSKNALSGSVAIVPIKKGEQIAYNKITEPGARIGLAPQVAPGRRAIAVPVTDTTGVAKLLKPGDRVDLIAVMDMGGGGKENRIAKTLLQDVVVLSVGGSVANNVQREVETDSSGKEKVKSLTTDRNYGVVTLEVEPPQAQVLALVLNNGDNALSLVLRNNDDTERTQLPSVMLTDVLGADAARARAPAGAKR